MLLFESRLPTAVHTSSCRPSSPLFLPKGTKVNFSFVPLHAGQYEALEKGRLDLVLNADYDAATAHLSEEFILKWILCASYPGRVNSQEQLRLSNT
jgi:hypothetical protein